MNLRTLVSNALELFKTEEDQKKLSLTDKRAAEMEAISDLVNSEAGKALISSLINDFFATLEALFKTREDRYISDLQSILNMINKLSVNQEIEALRSFLEDRINYVKKN